VQINPYYSKPDYVDAQQIFWTPLLGTERNGNQQPPFEDFANLGLEQPYDNVASTTTFSLPSVPEPHRGNIGQDTVDHPDLHSSIVQKLATLDVAIYECGLQIPFPIIAGRDSTATGTRKSRLFALDELFRLTTDFLDIFTSHFHVVEQPDLSPCSSTLPESETESSLPLRLNSQHLSKTVQSASTEERTKPFLPLDEATMFMIISCHCRLTEFYLFIFEKMQACIEHSLAPRRDKDWAIILPQLQVGSIASSSVQVDIDSPVSSATSSMYMLMITMLSSKLWGQLADAMRVGDCISVGVGSTAVLTDTVWDSVTNKNKRMLQTFDNTRCLLQRNCVVV
jgi:hypothetical protein